MKERAHTNPLVATLRRMHQEQGLIPPDPVLPGREGRLLAAVQRYNADRRVSRQRQRATGPLPHEFPIPPAPAA